MQVREIAGATQERTLLAVACRPMLGPYAATPPYNGKELGHSPAYTSRPAGGRVRPSTPVVLCARMLGWARFIGLGRGTACAAVACSPGTSFALAEAQRRGEQV